MGHQNKEMDVESLQKSGRRRGSCLDIFVVMSIIFLFMALAAVAVIGTMFAVEVRSKLDTTRQSITVGTETSKLTGDTPDPAYKVNN